MSDRRVALVTGSSRGIGRAIVERLAEDHDCVVHFRRRREDADEVAAKVEALGSTALVAEADLSTASGAQSIIDSIEGRFGRLDTLVASAAATKFTPLLQAEPRHLDRTLTAVVGSFLPLAQGLARLMRAPGRVVVVSGLDARFAQPGHALLGSAKAALEALVRSLAVELGPLGATANAVAPGAILTESLSAYFRGDERAQAAMLSGIPLQRWGTPSDVADLVGFLCSERASYISGQIIVADGGASAEGGSWGAFRGLW